MTAKDFKGANLFIANDQEQYETLPAQHDPKAGTIAYCMELTEAERQAVYATGEIWIKQLTFNGPMQPIFMTVRKEDIIKE